LKFVGKNSNKKLQEIKGGNMEMKNQSVRTDLALEERELPV